MRGATSIVVVGLGAWLTTSPAFALDTLPFCDKIADSNERMACLQAHVSHLEEQILGLSAQIADLTNRLRQKSEMETPYKLLFSQAGRCLGVDDQKKPGFVSCNNPDAFSLMDRSKSAPTKKPEPVAVTPDKPKKNKNKDKDNATAGTSAQPSTGSSSAQPSSPATANAPGQAVPKSAP